MSDEPKRPYYDLGKSDKSKLIEAVKIAFDFGTCVVKAPADLVVRVVTEQNKKQKP